MNRSYYGKPRGLGFTVSPSRLEMYCCVPCFFGRFSQEAGDFVFVILDNLAVLNTMLPQELSRRKGGITTIPQYLNTWLVATLSASIHCCICILYLYIWIQSMHYTCNATTWILCISWGSSAIKQETLCAIYSTKGAIGTDSPMCPICSPAMSKRSR